MSDSGNLFAGLRSELAQEELLDLLAAPGVHIERIVSTGQATPEDAWLDQSQGEWVILLRGAARLRFAGEAKPRLLKPGDYLNIPSHRRHRVEWTTPREPTVWLAVHYAA